MKIRIALLASVFWMVLAPTDPTWAVPAAATSYTVSTTGNDANPGTPQAPFRTIQRALDRAVAGDTVIVKAGVYRERVGFKASGQPGLPITLQGESGAVIDGGDKVTGWVPAPERGPRIYKKTMPYRPGNFSWKNKACIWIYESYLSDGSGWTWMNWDPGNPSWDGVEAMGADAGNVAYVRFRDGRDPNNEDIAIAPHYRLTPQLNVGAVTISGRSHVVVRGFTVRNAVNAVHLINATDCVVEQNRLLGGTHTVSLRDGTHRNVIRNNEITMDYVYPDSGYITGRSRIDNNIKTAWRAMTAINCGVHLWGAGDDNDVSKNNIHQYYGGIFVFVGQMKGLKAYGNTVHHASGYCLYIGQGTFSNCQFYDNVLFESDQTIRIDGFNGGPLYVYRNRVYDLTQQFAVKEKAGDFGLGGPVNSYGPVYFYHNSLSGSSYAVRLDGRIADKLYAVNNVFSGRKYAVTGTDAVSKFDHNWCGGAGGFKIGPNDIAAPDQRLWDPLNPTFTVTQNSTARLMGVDLSRPWTSRGVSHPALPGMAPGYFSGARPDAGAVQFGAATAVAPSITTQPASKTVPAGLTATFAVVSTGTAPLSYQWQKNGSTIAGATSASYATPATTGADSGSTFRVIITNSAGSVTSASATLTVVAAGDSDADGLPDAWELPHFGDLNQGANGDPDGDGATNLEEFQSGLDPMDPSPQPEGGVQPARDGENGDGTINDSLCGLLGCEMLIVGLALLRRRR